MTTTRWTSARVWPARKARHLGPDVYFWHLADFPKLRTAYTGNLIASDDINQKRETDFQLMI